MYNPIQIKVSLIKNVWLRRGVIIITSPFIALAILILNVVPVSKELIESAKTVWSDE